MAQIFFSYWEPTIYHVWVVYSPDLLKGIYTLVYIYHVFLIGKKVNEVFVWYFYAWCLIF